MPSSAASHRPIGSAGLRWALSTVAPWALSAGLLVSFTASAGQNAGLDTLPTTALFRTQPGPASELEEGPSLLVAASAFRLPGLSLTSAIQKAHLSFDDPERRFVIDPRQPREEMKRSAKGFPEVDRTAKGDPLPRLRPYSALSESPTISTTASFFAWAQTAGLDPNNRLAASRALK